MDTTRRANQVARVLATVGVLALLGWLAVLLWQQPEVSLVFLLYSAAVAAVALVGLAGVLRRDWRVTVVGAFALYIVGGQLTVGVVGLPATILLLFAGYLEHELTGARPLFN